MKRTRFLQGMGGASLLTMTDGFSSILKAKSMTDFKNSSEEFATFGAVHLNNTSLEKAAEFWTNIVGLKVRHTSSDVAEFGTENATLVVVHQSALKAYESGYSGLYHFAIHPPDRASFACMLHRLLVNDYPCSPTDHTMSQSVYLQDPDGITIEFTLETPERFKRVITQGGLKVEGTDGIIRTSAARLDVDEVFKHLPDHNTCKLIHNHSKIGHIHLYANHVERSDTFYKKLGFIEFNYLPRFLYADVGTGGAYQHRVAMNAWHGTNRPLAPKENAGLHHYQINYKSEEMLMNVLKSVVHHQDEQQGYWVTDPTGNRILLYLN